MGSAPDMNGRSGCALDIKSSGPLGEDPLAASLEECPVGNELSSSPPPASPQPPLLVHDQPTDPEEAGEPRASGGGAEIPPQAYSSLLFPLLLCPFNGRGGPRPPGGADSAQREGGGRLFAGGTPPTCGSSPTGCRRIVRGHLFAGVPLPPTGRQRGSRGLSEGLPLAGRQGGSRKSSEGLPPADRRRGPTGRRRGSRGGFSLPHAGPPPMAATACQGRGPWLRVLFRFSWPQRPSWRYPRWTWISVGLPVIEPVPGVGDLLLSSLIFSGETLFLFLLKRETQECK